MGEITRRPEGRLAGSTIAILMESDFQEAELAYYERRFAEEGATTLFLTRLWGQPSITFKGHEYHQPFSVEGDLEAVDDEQLSTIDALIVPSGMVSDRLRYSEDVAVLAPAVQLLRRAFANPRVLKGIICHGMWLVSPIPEVVRGRRVTCHNNLVSDIANMGAVYTDQDVVADGDLVTGRSADHCHLFARMIIDYVEARNGHSQPAAALGGASPSALSSRADEPSHEAEVSSEPAAAQSAPARQPGSATSAPVPSTDTVEAPAADHGAEEAAPDTEVAPSGDLAPTGSSQAGSTVEATGAVGIRPEQAQRESGGTYRPDFTFSDLVSGYVTGFDAEVGVLDLATSDGRPVRITLTGTTSAEFLRNLGAPYLAATTHLRELLVPGRHLFVHAIFYPEQGGYTLEAKRLILTGRAPGEFAFNQADWWPDQLRELARFYRRAQFGTTSPPDFRDYRTIIRLGGDKTDQHVQETDTISRLIYGMSSAFMLTGEQDFLDVAEAGAEYLRQHLRFVDKDEDIVYWYHAIDVRADGAGERKLFTSEFGDDYDAIPMYEQIYALVGLTQLYRITGSPELLSDIDATLRLMRRFFRDEKGGGYFSHIDPILLSPHEESLGPNQSRKNWNSVGDHAPAYLINLFLATGEQRHAEMLKETFDLIAEHFPDPDSPFVQERFHADWSPDREWNWQQDRAVVGHNLKIAWNMLRVAAVNPDDGYRKLAEEIGHKMPELAGDRQRGGWYDVVERQLQPGQEHYRFAWHDRKAWWQQEQAILAYLILAGQTGDEGFRAQAYEAASFYNAFFLDHDEGGVYFNVLADGTPYLVGTERLKGSHSMSMYHAAELCYLATVYQHLLLQGQPLTLWFRPRPDAFPDRVLRTAPDALPAGSVRLDWVEIDGRPYSEFDPEALTVKLPDSSEPVTVRVHLSSAHASTTHAPPNEG